MLESRVEYLAIFNVLRTVQAGRFALALETLEKALTVWGSTLGAEKKRSLRARYPEEQHVGDIRAVGRIESSTEEGPLLNAGEEGMYHNLQNMGGARSRRTRGGLHAADEVNNVVFTSCMLIIMFAMSFTGVRAHTSIRKIGQSKDDPT